MVAAKGNPPLPIFPIQIISGLTPKWYEAKTLPVLPKPVNTSSAIVITLYFLHNLNSSLKKIIRRNYISI